MRNLSASIPGNRFVAESYRVFSSTANLVSHLFPQLRLQYPWPQSSRKGVKISVIFKYCYSSQRRLHQLTGINRADGRCGVKMDVLASGVKAKSELQQQQILALYVTNAQWSDCLSERCHQSLEQMHELTSFLILLWSRISFSRKLLTGCKDKDYIYRIMCCYKVEGMNNPLVCTRRRKIRQIEIVSNTGSIEFNPRITILCHTDEIRLTSNLYACLVFVKGVVGERLNATSAHAQTQAKSCGKKMYNLCIDYILP